MDEADGLQYIAGFGGRNDVAARRVSYIPRACSSSLSALAPRRTLKIVLYASMIGAYLIFIVSLVLRTTSPDCLVMLSFSKEHNTFAAGGEVRSDSAAFFST